MDLMSTLKFSILTPSYNQGNLLERNILSVLNQNYENFEHIIVDGGSSDNTLEIIKKYPHLKWISEEDKGQADALNKGLQISSGEIIGWINSDDYYEPSVFSSIAMEFEKTDCKWVVGNMKEVDLIQNKERYIESPHVSYNALIDNPDIVKQPCTFFKKNLITEVGGWNENLYMVMDFDLWLRISKKAEPIKIEKCLANFVIHENQKTSTNNIKRQINEIVEVLRANKIDKEKINVIVRKKRKSLLKQRIKKILGIN